MSKPLHEMAGLPQHIAKCAFARYTCPWSDRPKHLRGGRLRSKEGEHRAHSSKRSTGGIAPRNVLASSFSLGLKLPSPPPSNSPIGRRRLLFRPITISAQSSRLGRTAILTVGMQSSSTNKSTTEPISQEDSNKINSDENASASTENSSWLSFGLLSTLFNVPIWAKFVLGSFVLLAIPILRKSGRIKDVTKTVEEAAELVEKAAEVTEKVAEEIAEALPEGRFKEAAVKLEKIALLVDKEAEFTESIIDKVDDVLEAVDTNLKLVNGEISKKNDEEDETTVKKIVVDRSNENLQG